MQITADTVIRFIEGVAARIKEHRDELTQLDSAIGDADHGANLDRGFTAVLAKLPTVADKDIGTILKTTGMTLVSTVGGASGPLYGTAYMRAGMALADRYEMTENELVAALEAALEGIIARGKAQRGEKTMVDAIAPGIEALKTALADGSEPRAAIHTALEAVQQGVQDTIPLLATKGRASYLGDRSIGHQDPGATSAFYMAQVMVETLDNIS